MRLIEPLGLIDGLVAAEAIRRGDALPLAGGPLAFLYARLLPGGAWVPAGDIPVAFHDQLALIMRAPPPWAGLSGPAVMGVLNVTPDSFSDGGSHFDPSAAIAAGRAMAQAGVDILDIGGESTRPGSVPVTPAEEIGRILPVIAALAGRRLSVDTRNAATMAAALDAGATVINDVSALRHDPDAAGLLARRGCPVVLMHMRGDPATMNSLAHYDDVALAVVTELEERLRAAAAAGIARANIALDPGIGFAKTAAHNRALLARLPLLLNLGCRVVAGVSRKRFIGALSGEADPRRRGPGSLAAALYAVSRGATILRAHDAADTVQALRVWSGLAAPPDNAPPDNALPAAQPRYHDQRNLEATPR